MADSTVTVTTGDTKITITGPNPSVDGPNPVVTPPVVTPPVVTPPSTGTLAPGEWVPAAATVGATQANYLFADECSAARGTAPDPTKWTHITGVGATVGGNNETEIYTSNLENSYYDGNGHLVIAVTNNAKGGFNSARLVTQGKFALPQSGGHWEASIAFDNTPGCWPAFWFMGTKGQWPGCGEIDLMETYGNGVSDGTVWTGTSPSKTSNKSGRSASPVDNAFHVYRLDLTTSVASLYRDNKLFNQVRTSDISPWPFASNGGLYALLNIATDGIGTNGVSPKASVMPTCMLVDYVRAWA